jgi:hypothetical protein
VAESSRHRHDGSPPWMPCDRDSRGDTGVAMKWRRSWRYVMKRFVTQFGRQGVAPSGSLENTKLERSMSTPEQSARRLARAW